MADYDYDLFVIGAGSGGVRAARLAAMSGARVAVAEEYRVGGTCVVRGCIPKKLMVYASEFPKLFELAKGYGWSGQEAAKFDWKTFLVAKDIEISRLSGIYVANLTKAGVDILKGKARFTGPHTLEIEGHPKPVTAAKILIATGGRPKLPEVPGVEHAITSDQAFHLENLPKRIVVVGGGYIAVEFACIFHGLGVETTLVYRGSNVLRGFDEDVRSHIADEFRKRGLRVALSCSHSSIEKTSTGLLSCLSEGMKIESDQVMFATGREPYVEGLGLETVGVELTEGGAIKVDDQSRTNVPHIWAVGDVTDRINLTPVAIREGQAFAETEFYNRPMIFDHQDVATAVFSQPPVGVVGLTEAEARHQYGGGVDVYLTRFRPMKTGFAGSEERMLMKLVVEAKSGRVLGVHIVGPDAAEMIQLAAIAVKAGLTKAQWDATCAVHPTAAEELVTLREKYIPPELAAAQ
jgi:glutathione reductase (NADPH)